jgi:hypothetical protein
VRFRALIESNAISLLKSNGRARLIHQTSPLNANDNILQNMKRQNIIGTTNIK